MATPAEFAREARAIQRVEQAPPAWEAAFADESGVAVFAAELRGRDGRTQLLTPRADATERQRREFSRARTAWQRHGGERAIVPLVASGDEPRPWLALDAPESGLRPEGEPLPDETVRALLADLAEGCWVIQQSAWPGAPEPRQYRTAADGATAGLYWPLSIRDGSAPEAVRAVGEVGYEAITGEEPTEQRDRLPPSVREPDRRSDRLCEVVETALAAPSEGYANCYELKRALLFGPETGRAGDPQANGRAGRAEGSEPTAGQSADGEPAVGRSESGAATTDHGGQPQGDGGADGEATERGRPVSGVGRRAVVGALGLSAIPLAGAFAVRSSESDADSQTPEAPEPPEASFAFADEGTAIRVTHAGGDSIAADRLIVRNTRYSGTDDYEWAPFSAEDTVEPGDTISIDVEGRVRMFAHVLWRSPDGEEVVLDRRGSGGDTRESGRS